MDRPSPTVVRFRIDQLHPGPLEVPELLDVGVRLEIVAPEEVPGFQLHPHASAYARSISTAAEDVTLAVWSNDPDLEVFAVDASGGRHHPGLRTTGSSAHWTFTAQDLRHLVVRIPPTLVSRWNALHGGAAMAAKLDGPRPDWDLQLVVLDRFVEMYAAADDAETGRGAKVVAALRDSLDRRRAAWPAPPPGPFSSSPSRKLDGTWGRQALLDALAAVDAAGLGRAVDPFDLVVGAVAHAGLRFDDVPIGVSHVHGYPHVPAGFSWPEWDCPGYDPGEIDDGLWQWQSPGGTGPLTFLAQVNLAEVPLFPSWPGPRAGWLLFFADVGRLEEADDEADRHRPGAHRVIYVRPGVELHRLMPPWKHPVYGHEGWRERDPGAGVRYIGYGRTAWLTFEPIEVPRLVSLQQAYVDDPRALPEDLGQWVRAALNRARREQHWIGGEPNPCQDDPLGFALRHGLGIDDRAALRQERGAWMQLLQLASDESTETLWGDGGLLHFFIREDDLRACRFDRTLLTSQSF